MKVWVVVHSDTKESYIDDFFAYEIYINKFQAQRDVKFRKHMGEGGLKVKQMELT